MYDKNTLQCSQDGNDHYLKTIYTIQITLNLKTKLWHQSKLDIYRYGILRMQWGNRMITTFDGQQIKSYPEERLPQNIQSTFYHLQKC